MSTSGKIAIYVSKVNEKYIVQWGTYYNRNDDMLAPQFSNPAALVASIAGTIILQQREKPGVHRYFNYEYYPDSGFKRRNLSTEILREEIDHYELDNATRVTFKTYIDYKMGVAAIYYNLKEGYLKIVAFE